MINQIGVGLEVKRLENKKNRYLAPKWPGASAEQPMGSMASVVEAVG